MFKPSSFRKDTSLNYYDRSLMRGDTFVNRYNIDAIWFSARSATRGSLVIGHVDFMFNYETDIDMSNLSYSEVLAAAGKEDLPNGIERKSWSFNAKTLLGKNSAWTSGYNSETLENIRSLVAATDALPQTLEGYEGWFKHKK